jgi:hypothetical protein
MDKTTTFPKKGEVLRNFEGIPPPPKQAGRIYANLPPNIAFL